MRFRRHPRTASRVIDGRAAVISVDTNRLVSLNPQATRVWEALAEPRTLAELAVRLCAYYEVSLDVAQADCEGFLNELAAKGLVVTEA